MSDYSEFSERIVKIVNEFKVKLESESGIQHTSTQAFGGIVEHFAKKVIDKELDMAKYKLVDGELKLIQEIVLK